MNGQPKSDVTFDVALDRGVVVVGVKPRLGLEASRVSNEIPILDLMDLFANMLLGLNHVQREAIAQVRAGKLPTTLPPAPM